MIMCMLASMDIRIYKNSAEKERRESRSLQLKLLLPPQQQPPVLLERLHGPRQSHAKIAVKEFRLVGFVLNKHSVCECNTFILCDFSAVSETLPGSA